MAPGSVASVSTVHEDPSHYLSSSISSLSSQRAQSSWIAKTYRQAAQLYLTRRLAQALDTIEPAVFPDTSLPGRGNEGSERDKARKSAPVAQSSRGTRVKIWSFYLTLLNAIIELGPDEGKLAFGSTRWKTIAAKARTGNIWDDVVVHGYGGNEGQVDGEVAANLATLLLTHMPDQRRNQQRLETYLSAVMYPSYDVAAHIATAQNNRPQPHRTESTGTSTPRDLNTRLKLLELYTLHVLPRNEEWDYAREFINMSEVLDEERREAFLAALASLREEKTLDAIRQAELRKRQEEEAEKERQDQARKQHEQDLAKERHTRDGKQALGPNDSHDDRVSSPRPPPPNHSGQRKATSSRPNRPARRVPQRQLTLYQRLSLIATNIQSSLSNASNSIRRNPTAALRYLLFFVAFLMALARRNVRLKIQRLLGDASLKIRQTIGMGTKVSYI